MNEPAWDDDGSGGIDRDEMGRSLGIVGADTRGTQGDSVPSAGSQFSDPLWVTGRYAWDWRGMGLCYPLMRAFGRSFAQSTRAFPGGVYASLYRSGANSSWTQAPAFDAETHEQSTSSRRSHNSLAIHSSAAAWLLHASGIALHSIWYWGRDEFGGVMKATWPNVSTTSHVATSPADAFEKLLAVESGTERSTGSGFPYSYLVFPAAMDAAARAQTAVNSVANELAYLATGYSEKLPGLGPSDRVCGLFSLPSKVRLHRASCLPNVKRCLETTRPI